MAGFGARIYNTLSAAIFGLSNDSNDNIESEIEYSIAIYESDRYKPSVQDVLTVKKALHKKSTLPYELVDTIIEMAEYWPHNRTVLTQPTSVMAGRDHENRFLLRSYPLGYPHQTTLSVHEEYQIGEQLYGTMQPKPWLETRHVPDEDTKGVLSNWTAKSLPKGEHPCRKIVFTIKSHDQGWGGAAHHRGTYDGSYTWFDVGLERISATREGIILDSPEIAPTPQFKLSRNDLGGNGSTEKSASWKPRELLICNLRTIFPATEPKSPNTSDDNLGVFKHDLLPSTMALQKNITAMRDTREHKITWSYTDNVVTDSLDAAELEKQGRGRETANGEFVRNLMAGDVVTVWGKARFPQWINYVEEISIDVYWAV